MKACSMTQHVAAFGGLDTESDALPPDHPTTLFHYAKRLSSSMWFYTTAGLKFTLFLVYVFV